MPSYLGTISPSLSFQVSSWNDGAPLTAQAVFRSVFIPTNQGEASYGVGSSDSAILPQGTYTADVIPDIDLLDPAATKYATCASCGPSDSRLVPSSSGATLSVGPSTQQLSFVVFQQVNLSGVAAGFGPCDATSGDPTQCLIEYGDITLTPTALPIATATKYLPRTVQQSVGSTLSSSLAVSADPGLYDIVIHPSSATYFPWILLPATLVPQQQSLALGTVHATPPVQLAGHVKASSGLPIDVGRVQAFGVLSVGGSPYRFLVAEVPVASDGSYQLTLPSAYQSTVRFDHAQAIGLAFSGFAWASLGGGHANYVPPTSAGSTCAGGATCSESVWTTSKDGLCVSTCVAAGNSGCDTQISLGVDASSQSNKPISGSYQTLSVDYSGAPSAQSVSLQLQVALPAGGTYCVANYVSGQIVHASDFKIPCGADPGSQQPLANFSSVLNLSLA
jgi:hypothetical protein